MQPINNEGNFSKNLTFEEVKILKTELNGRKWNAHPAVVLSTLSLIAFPLLFAGVIATSASMPSFGKSELGIMLSIPSGVLFLVGTPVSYLVLTHYLNKTKAHNKNLEALEDSLQAMENKLITDISNLNNIQKKALLKTYETLGYIDGSLSSDPTKARRIT